MITEQCGCGARISVTDPGRYPNIDWERQAADAWRMSHAHMVPAPITLRSGPTLRMRTRNRSVAGRIWEK